MGMTAEKIRGEIAPTYQFPISYGTMEGIKAEFKAVGFSPEHVEIVESFMDVSDPEPLVDLIRGKIQVRCFSMAITRRRSWIPLWTRS